MPENNSKTSRKNRLQIQIQQIIAIELINNTKDHILNGVTIVEVELTGDLHDAKVYFQSHSEFDPQLVEKSLNRASGRFRKALANELHTRLTPSITFVSDVLSERVANIDDLLAKAAASDRELAKQRETAEFANSENPYK